MTNFAFFSSGESLIVALCAVIASGILRGYSGFGAALIIIPIFSNLYSPLVALSFHVLIEMPSLVVLLPAGIRAYDRKLVNSSLLVLILAVPFGFHFILFSFWSSPSKFNCFLFHIFFDIILLYITRIKFISFLYSFI